MNETRKAKASTRRSGDDSTPPRRKRAGLTHLLGLSLLLWGLVLVVGANASHTLEFSFGEPGTQGGQLDRLHAVAVNHSGDGAADPGDLYVADTGNHRIQQFDLKGNFIRAWGADIALPAGGNALEVCTVAAECKAGSTSVQVGGALNAPIGVAVDQSDGSVYVFDGANRRIQKFDAEGGFLWASGGDVLVGGTTVGPEVCTVASECKAGPFQGPWGGELGNNFDVNSRGEVAVDPTDGSIYVTDFNGRRVQQFSPSGTFLRAFGYGVVDGGATGTGNVTAGSTQITGVVTTSKVFLSAGQLVRQAITGPGIPPDTTITTVQNGGIINISQPATASGTGVPLTVPTGAGNIPQNERQVVTIGAGVTEGNFKLSFTTPAPNNTTAAANTTANIPFNASPAEVDERLEELGNIGAGQVTVTSPNPGGGAAGGGPYTIEFDGPRYADTDVNLLRRVDGEPNLNVSGDAGAAISERTRGTSAFEVCTASTECKIFVQGPNEGSEVGMLSGSPSSIAVDSTGAVYTLESGRVQKFTPQAGPPALSPALFAPAIIGATGGSSLTHVAVGASDDVYVGQSFSAGTGNPPAAVGERRILQIDSGGTELLHTHLAGEAIASQGVDPSPQGGLAIDPSRNRLYILTVSSSGGDPRIHVFTDSPPDKAPVVTTGATSPGAAAHLRMLEGTVNPVGFRVTECRFLYGTTTAYGESTPCLPPPCASGSELCEGEDAVAVSASTVPLEPNTTYHYRLLAANAGEASQGEDRTFTTGPAPADGCSNATIRAAQGTEVMLLPDCMALEQVSPSKKGNQDARLPSAISADGERVLFNSTATIGDCHNAETIGGNSYLATRANSGWDIDCVQAPVGIGGKMQFSFTPDLSRWFHLGEFGDVTGNRHFRRDLDGLASPITPSLPVGTRPAGASFDHSSLYLTPGFANREQPFLDDDPEPTGLGEEANLYVASLDSEGSPPLKLLAKDRGGKIWGGNCGARLGGVQSAPGTDVTLRNGERNQGAISPDGSRVYFSTRPAASESGDCEASHKMRILERLETPAGPAIEEIVPNDECNRVSPACSTIDGDDVYQGASEDQSLVYFTTTRQLADADLDQSTVPCSDASDVPGCDLYLLDRDRPDGERLIQVSAGEASADTQGEGAAVRNSITAISADGSRAYFVAQTRLTTDKNPEGAEAQPGQSNLYLYEHPSEDISFVGTLADADAGGIFGGNANWANGAYAVPIEGSGDGHILLFRSRAPLTADDADSASDLFRYDAVAETLARISVAAPGGSDDGASGVSVQARVRETGTDYAERDRWASEDGETVVFTTVEALAPGDLNEVEDVYMWREGKVYRLPGGAQFNSNLRVNTPVVSHDGSLIAYHSARQLLPSDGDTVQDVYVVRVAGGYPLPPALQVCEGEACQGAPDTAAADVGAASAGFAGRGNVREGRSCARPARQARRLSKRAKRGRRNARRLARNGKRGQAKALHRRATRLARKARRTSKRAKRCRSARAADTNRRAGK